MPFIGVMVSTDVTEQQQKELNDRLCKAVVLLPGKSAASLMVCIKENSRLYFKESSILPTAFVEVKLFGKSTKQAYAALTAEICNIMQEVLCIPAARTYVKYEEADHWGCNGHNF